MPRTDKERRATRRRWYNKNRVRELERAKLWRAKHIDIVKERARSHYIANKKTIAEKRRAYRKANPSVVKSDLMRLDIWKKNNKDRIKEINIRWRKANLSKISAYARKSRLKNTYGITEDEAQQLLEKPCSICKRPSTDIDHDHKTGKVRGALCNSCNLGLGKFRDDADLLKKAIRYLEKHSKST